MRVLPVTHGELKLKFRKLFAGRNKDGRMGIPGRRTQVYTSLEV